MNNLQFGAGMKALDRAIENMEKAAQLLDQLNTQVKKLTNDLNKGLNNIQYELHMKNKY